MLVSHSPPLLALFRVGGSHLPGSHGSEFILKLLVGLEGIFLSQRCGPKEAIRGVYKI